MDDLRVQWIRDRVYKALGLTDPQLFEELLVRDDGEAEDLILHFLNQTSEEEGAATLFIYRKVVPEEVEVEVDTEKTHQFKSEANSKPKKCSFINA